MLFESFRYGQNDARGQYDAAGVTKTTTGYAHFTERTEGVRHGAMFAATEQGMECDHPEERQTMESRALNSGRLEGRADMSDPVLPSRRIAEIDGRSLAFRDTSGSGPGLVLLHGLGGGSETWEFQFGGLADRYRIIAWDMPGYGASQGFETATPDVRDYARVLGLLLDSLDIEAAHVVGQSVAALVGAAFAVTRPGQVRSYTFCQGLPGLGHLPDTERVKERDSRIETMRSIGPHALADHAIPRILCDGAPPETVERATRIMRAVPVSGYCQAVEMMSRADFATLAPGIEAPSFVISGGADPVSSPDIALMARADLGPGPVHVIDGVGHYGCMEKPSIFNSVLDAFLASV